MSQTASSAQRTPYIIALVFIWVLGGWLQYRFCCPTENQANGKKNTPVAALASTQTTTAPENKPTSTTTPAPISSPHSDDSHGSDSESLTQNPLETDLPKDNESSPVALTEEKPRSPTTGLVINSPQGQAIIETQHAITFSKNQATANDIAPDIQQAFSGKLNEYFKQNPDQSLLISGYYTADETAPSGFANLGLARAEQLKSWLKQQSVTANISTTSKKQDQLAGTDTTHLIAAQFDVVKRPPSSDTRNVIRYLPFYLDTGDHKLSGKDNFVFASNDFIANQPLTEELEDNLQQAVTYLKNHPSRKLRVTGRYHPNETNRSIASDLGMARANHIKDYLVFLGITPKQIEVSSQAYPEAVSDNQHRYLGMANFSLSPPDKTRVVVAAKKPLSLTQQLSEDIRANPLVLYFKTGNANIALTEQQRERLMKVTQYLNASPNSTILITGHTDSTGNREKNIQLGKERAKFAATYLEKTGLNRKQMVINSKGPDQPIADNKTAKGRSKNRRVVITVNETN